MADGNMIQPYSVFKFRVAPVVVGVILVSFGDENFGDCFWCSRKQF